MELELSRSKVKKGRSYRVDKWMKFLNDHLKEILVMLEGEKMYVEAIFGEQLDGVF